MTQNPFAVFKHKKHGESTRHAKRNWKKRAKPFSFSKLVLVLSVIFFFLPLVVVVILSFNASKGSTFTEFSFKWYGELFTGSAKLWKALWNSVIVALISSALATVLGSLASIGMGWYKFKGKSYIQVLSFLPMILPEVIMGVSMLIFFSWLKIQPGLFTIIVAHTTFCLPFVYLMVSARIDEFDYSIIEASHDLGANEIQTLFKVIIPAIMPGVLSGFMMSITMSFDDYVITKLVSGSGVETLPIYIYNSVRHGVSPIINCISFIMIIFTVVITLCLRKSLKSFAAAK